LRAEFVGLPLKRFELWHTRGMPKRAGTGRVAMQASAEK